MNSVSIGVSENDMPRTNRKHKERVFLMLYNDKRELLKLYNAINGTDYGNPDELEIVTLENAIYMSMKNNLAFVIRSELNLYEHQSTKNPNMPLRDLLYIAHEYQKLIDNKELFLTKAISIPAPRFFMFYNGKDSTEDRFELKLSDLYNPKVDEPELELRVTVLNINLGRNRELMDKCDTLNEYAIYVDKVRRYQKVMSNDEAVRRAVNECIDENVLKDFFMKQKEEVIAMSIFEYDEEAVLDYIGQKQWEDGRAAGRAEGYESGRAEGYESGKAEGVFLQQVMSVRKNILKGKSIEVITEFVDLDMEVVCRIAEYMAENPSVTDEELMEWYINNRYRINI